MALAFSASPIRNKTKELGQIFTPADITDLMVSLISETSNSVLEPSAGEGAFIS